MSETSPLEAYRNACNLYREIQDLDDDPLRVRRLRAHNQTVQACFRRLMGAADSRDPEIWYALGGAFMTGTGTERDRAEAFRWFQRAAESGHTPAMIRLGIYLQRWQSSSDPKAAIVWFLGAAERGDPSGMISLGFTYRDGRGVACDFAEAVRWFFMAVEAGDGHSMIYVGRMYARYLSSPGRAISWFLRAAAAGFDESFIELASLYDDRESEFYNPTEAHKWYRVVAEYSEGTHSRALMALARQHLDGRGVPRDVKMAKLWLWRLLQAVPQKSSAHREASKLLKRIENQFL